MSVYNTYLKPDKKPNIPEVKAETVKETAAEEAPAADFFESKPKKGKAKG